MKYATLTSSRRGTSRQQQLIDDLFEVPERKETPLDSAKETQAADPEHFASTDHPLSVINDVQGVNRIGKIQMAALIVPMHFYFVLWLLRGSY
jgi:hypothetical protein